MTENLLTFWYALIWIVAGSLGLALFAWTLAVRRHGKTKPSGHKGHREKADDIGHEVIRPDGYIDSFAREIEEAGGGLPLIVKVTMVGILLWWVLYLIYNWTPNL